MVLAALLLLLSSPHNPPRADFQEMTGAPFQHFARMANAMCPSRNLRDLFPANLSLFEEQFEVRLSPQSRKRLASLDKRWEGRPEAGASCPAQHNLEALEKMNLLRSFTSFACSSGN